jgi:hypothetical protein
MFAIAMAQDQSAVVTLETPAMNAPAVVQMVADATGRKIAASPEMARDVLLIKVKDADVQGVLDRIAKATYGKWVDREGVSTLVPDNAARKEASDASFAKSMKDIEKMLQAWENPQDQNFDDSDMGEMTKEEIREYQAMRQNEIAQQKAFAQLIRAIGIRRLAALEPGERIVFSDRPTPAQLRLNAPWAPFYNVMKSRFESGNYDFDAEGMFGEEAMPPEMAEFMGIQRAMAAQVKPFDGTPVKFLLAVQRASNTGMYGNGSMPSVNANLFCLDKNGTSMYVSSMSFDGPNSPVAETMEAVPSQVGEEEVEVPEQQPQGRPIKFTPEEAEIGLGMYGSSVPEKTVARIMASFTDTTKDPLDLIGGTILRRIGETGDLDVVANVPDSITGIRYMLSKDYQANATIEAFLQNMTYFSTFAEEKDGWLTMSPLDYNQFASLRMDRPTLAAYAASLNQGTAMRLDVAAEFMYRNPYASSNPLFQMLRELSPAANMWVGNDNTAMMRFWGSLSDGQRRSLRSGQKVSTGTLSKASRDLLAGYIYNTELQLQMPPPAALTNYSLPARTMLSLMMFGGMGGGGNRSWVSEPTESLPQGLPQNGVISMESWSEVCFVQGLAGVNPMMPGILGATEMVMLDAFKLAAPSEAQEVLNALPTKATVGTRTNMTLTIALTNQAQCTGQLSDVELDPQKRTVSLTALPQDLKDSIQTTRKEIAVLEAFMKYMVGSMGDGEGGQRPPP